jgi:recombination protein RecR
LDLLEKLTRSLSRLPGLGRKSASRIVHSLLKADREFVQELAREILDLKEKVQLCRICGCYTEEQPCALCSDPSRDRTQLCVVEQPKDVQSIEAIHEYRGLYHVLMGVISPIEGVGPEKLRIQSLVDRVRNEGIREVILATNPTVEGDTTALYLGSLLRGEWGGAAAPGVSVSRLALGLPVGGDLEYADRLTLARAFLGRSSF